MSKAISFYGMPTNPMHINYDFGIETGEKRVPFEQITVGPSCLGIDTA